MPSSALHPALTFQVFPRRRRHPRATAFATGGSRNHRAAESPSHRAATFAASPAAPAASRTGRHTLMACCGAFRRACRAFAARQAGLDAAASPIPPCRYRRCSRPSDRPASCDEAPTRRAFKILRLGTRVDFSVNRLSRRAAGVYRAAATRLHLFNSSRSMRPQRAARVGAPARAVDRPQGGRTVDFGSVSALPHGSTVRRRGCSPSAATASPLHRTKSRPRQILGRR